MRRNTLNFPHFVRARPRACGAPPALALGRALPCAGARCGRRRLLRHADKPLMFLNIPGYFPPV
jgi:hypothetical protein